ncbi:MAG: hypothetical protein ABIQ35_03995, partial [Verrucomicrobiota bacterium]
MNFFLGLSRRVFITTVASGLFSQAFTAFAAQPVLANPILFVTQVPMPVELNAISVSNVVVNVASPLGNHLADTAHAARGNDLWIRYPNGALTNLTRATGYGVLGAQHTNGIAVRQPAMHWSGTKAVFSMVVGAPRFAGDTNQFFWQLFEISNFLYTSSAPVITRVPNQSANYNNVSPTYGTDDRIIFSCDRPRDGSPHLYPQLDEYNDIPTVTGLWSLDPVTGNLFMLNHTPSGVFTPFVDSFGRLIFTRWDHLVQDRNATDDRLGNSTNGTFNYDNETANSPFDTNNRAEIFPEPRTFDATNLAVLKVRGNAFNSFFPWQLTEDGTGEELLNRVGRHELMLSFLQSFTNDPNLIAHSAATRANAYGLPTTNYLNNFLQICEDPTNPGTYFGIDAVDFGTHGAGQILSITGPPGRNPDSAASNAMFITYITPKTTAQPTSSAGFNKSPLPMSDGTLVAAHSSANGADANQGTAAAPKSLYDFRLTMFQKVGGFYQPGQFLTAGLTNPVSYWNGTTLVTYTNQLWELDPVEVRARTRPSRTSPPINPIEKQVFDDEGVDVATMQNYLRANNLAMIVSRNVTTRDRADKQQPYNLKVGWPTSATITTNTSGKIYDIGYLQLFQADQIRGLTFGKSTPAPGRRVLAQPMHEPVVDNLPAIPGAPAGSVKIADDGSLAAFVPARRAMTWHLTDTNGASVVKERYWVTFQPGEIRTCTSCHGLNSKDQAGQNFPTNPPVALRDLLRYWKSENIPVAGTQTNGTTNFLSLTFKRQLAATNLTHTVEVSDDLTNWFAGSSYSITNVLPITPNTTEVARNG